jgi:coenzyme F420 biosynthesis associated uncharacterized protein
MTSKAQNATPATAADMVDWDLAVRLGSRLAGEGPTVSWVEAADAVAQLRADADRSTGMVREFTGLVADEHTAPVLVVDRAGWVQANADAFQVVLGPLVAKLGEKRPQGLSKAIGSRVTGAEVGGLLGFLAGKVLGQFDPFHQADGAHGRLLLVAPNVVHVERELDVDPTDFRLWVCLHEETHRVQFTAVPWMRDHLFSEVTALAETLEPAKVLDDGLKRVSEALRKGPRSTSLVDLLGSPEQKEILDRVTVMMSLLEGHADVVMDGVGPSVIPSVSEIRAKFNQRRKGVGPLDRVLRRVLGLDAKMAQYRDGAKFVHGVVDKVGMAEFNAIWDSPANLPSKAEIADPAAWVSRVL